MCRSCVASRTIRRYLRAMASRSPWLRSSIPVAKLMREIARGRELGDAVEIMLFVEGYPAGKEPPNNIFLPHRSSPTFQRCIRCSSWRSRRSTSLSSTLKSQKGDGDQFEVGVSKARLGLWWYRLTNGAVAPRLRKEPVPNVRLHAVRYSAGSGMVKTFAIPKQRLIAPRRHRRGITMP